jgi:hypothetical protein
MTLFKLLFSIIFKVVLSELVFYRLHVNDLQFICYMSKDMSSICFQVYSGVGICNLKSSGNAYEWCKETLKAGFSV